MKNDIFKSPYYYFAAVEYTNDLLSKFYGGKECFSSLLFDSKEDCIKAKKQMESFLSSKHRLCHSWWWAADSFIRGKGLDYISTTLKLADCDYYYDHFLHSPSMFVYKHRHGFLDIDVVVYLNKLLRDREIAGETERREIYLSYSGSTEFEMLAKMMWDNQKRRILLTPIILL